MRSPALILVVARLCISALILQYIYLGHHVKTQVIEAAFSGSLPLPPPTDSTVLPSEVLRTRNTMSSPRPRAILHVGPHKTGSSAFQEFCYSNKPTLLEDNFLLPHLDDLFRSHKTVANLAFCLNVERDPVKLHCDEVFRNTENFLNDARQQGSNVLISSEEFSKAGVDLDHLKALLDGFDVEVVVVYRRYYDYLRSLYFELHRHVDQIYKARGIEGLLERPTLAEWLTTENRRTWRLHHTNAVLARYRRFGRVQVFSWYTPGDFLSQFVCSLNLPHTCRQAQSIEPAPRNAAYSFDPEKILAEGHRRGLVDWGELVQQEDYNIIHRQLNEFLTEQQQQGNRVEYTCLGETQEQKLFNLSLQMEEAILPSIGSSELGDFNEDFRKRRPEFCSLNATDLFDRYQAPLEDLLRSFTPSVLSRKYESLNEEEKYDLILREAKALSRKKRKALAVALVRTLQSARDGQSG